MELYEYLHSKNSETNFLVEYAYKILDFVQVFSRFSLRKTCLFLFDLFSVANERQAEQDEHVKNRVFCACLVWSILVRFVQNILLGKKYAPF